MTCYTSTMLTAVARLTDARLPGAMAACQDWVPFYSHLAMRGAPPRAIQELAGHRELGMTQRYMHLSPAALDSAIRLLDQPLAVQSWRHFGDGRGVRRKD